MGVTQTEYARIRGVTKGRVSQWKAAGMLVFLGDGSVDVAGSNAKLAGVLDVAKRAAYQRAEMMAGAVAPDQLQIEVPFPPQAPPVPSAGSTQSDATVGAYNAARAAKEQELALVAKLNREEREGLLVRRSEVDSAAAAIARILQQGLESLPGRLAPKLAAESDAVAVESILRREIRQLRMDLAKQVARAFVPVPEDLNNA